MTAADFLRAHEGCRLTAYQDTGGIWTIGYGSIRDVEPGMTITQAEAEERLQRDLAPAEHIVELAVKVPLSPNQAAALACFAFNVGGQAFESSTLLRKLNEGLYEAVPAELMRWVHDNGREVPGLVNRRKAECELWQGEAPPSFLDGVLAMPARSPPS